MVAPPGTSIALHGFDADHQIENVLFRNFLRGDEPVDGPEEIDTNAFVRKVRFETTD